jgi:large subunit ribosomal protein L3
MKAKQVGILGKKLGMTQMFWNDAMVGVTVVDFSGLEYMGSRTAEKDGYNAAIVGINNKNGKSKGCIREVRLDNTIAYQDGSYIDLFDSVKKVDVVGFMKGRGFQGVMRRHGFHGGPASHGAKHWHRRPGSIGGHTFPAKTFRGQKMPGHMGNTKVCTLSQDLVKLDKENKLIFIRGSVPGAKNAYVLVRDAVKG